ncbi:MAG: adenylate/guanylate cyclase domain-containing protein, partial [Bradyrhizobium sp.]|nr:adenylate/guanylate cyclase domain-containing protein [Bradyrhizobium sp.]
MDRRLAAIVCADVAGYSRMMGIDEAGTHAAFKAHRAAIHPLILNHAGRIVKHTGDGFLLEFASVVDAVQFGLDMQSLMADRNADLPAERNMRFRVGIHIGEVIIDEEEVFGE